MKPENLYHGSPHKIDGPLTPILEHTTTDHLHTRPAVFATERSDIAALFMFPLDILASIGFEHDVAYICIWGTREEVNEKTENSHGYLYTLPGESFEKIGKEYEWQSFEAVIPTNIRFFENVLTGMMQCGVHVYCIDNESIFDKIVANKNNRTDTLKNLVPENEKAGNTVPKNLIINN